jgi:hypothetical protein
MVGLVVMLILCFLPSLYKHDPRSFVTYELLLWLVSFFCFVFFFINDIAEATEYIEAIEYIDGWSIGIGGVLFGIGNILIPIGLYQIWNGVGGGYVPPVFDARGGSNQYDREHEIHDNYAPRSSRPYPIERPHQPAAPVYKHPRGSLTTAWLVDRNGRNHQLNSGETTIGRSSDNDIRIENAKVSKHHAKIIEQNGRFTIVDLGSTNGTWLNGKLIREPKLLHTNDEICLGDSYKTSFLTQE